MDLFLQPGFVEILYRPSCPSPATKSDTKTFRDYEYVALKVFVSKHRQAQNEEKVCKHLPSELSIIKGIIRLSSFRLLVLVHGVKLSLMGVLPTPLLPEVLTTLAM
jgi:hypothetical protein